MVGGFNSSAHLWSIFPRILMSWCLCDKGDYLVYLQNKISLPRLSVRCDSSFFRTVEAQHHGADDPLNPALSRLRQEAQSAGQLQPAMILRLAGAPGDPVLKIE